MRAFTRVFGFVLLTAFSTLPLTAQLVPFDGFSDFGPAVAAPATGAGTGIPLSGVDGLRSQPVGAPQVTTERNRRKGALWGAGVGLVAGGILGGLSVESEEDDGFGGSLAESAATSTAVVLGAGLGAGLGALLGATVFAPSRTAPAADERFAIHLAPQRRGEVTGVRVGLRWRR